MCNCTAKCNCSANLEYYSACYCTTTGCGGHFKIQAKGLDINWHPIGWQGAAQHTYTRSCDGFHAPGPCPVPLR